MIRYFLFHLFWSTCFCVPQRPSKWHGRPSSSSSAVLTAACGRATTALDNPWAAILYAHNNFRCGATILEYQLAITAAHCVISIHTDDLTLYYGRTYQPDSGIEDQGARFGGHTEILAVRIHPNYNTFYKFEGYDIAVLKLARRLRFNDYVKPIKIVPTHYKYDILYESGSSVRIASFGQTKGPINSGNPNDYPDQMQVVENFIVAEQKCNRGNGTYRLGPPQDGLCTRGKCHSQKNQQSQANFKQVCPGDSGSRMVKFFQEDNQFYLIAVISYTVTHNKKVCGLSKLPSLSIKTRNHRDFIYEYDFSVNYSNVSTTITPTPEPISSPISTKAPVKHVIGDTLSLTQTWKKCGNYQVCTTKDSCPSIEAKYKNLLRSKQEDHYKIILRELREVVCNKDKKGFCCETKHIGTYLPHPPQCGLNPFKRSGSVVGDFPFFALFGNSQNKDEFFSQPIKCGGILINHWYVLTGASCFSTGFKISKVVLGALQVGQNTYSGNSEDVQWFDITKEDVTIHQNYEKYGYNVVNNIALVRLNKPAVMNARVQMACLPLGQEEELLTSTSGRITNGIALGPTRYQSRGGSKLINSNQCEESYDNIFEMKDGNVCASEEGRRHLSTCELDLGGGLMLSAGRIPGRGEASVPWYLIGVFNFGTRYCSKPSIYTRVSYYTQWIKDNLRL